jgi:hypothetical protein
LQNQEKDTLCHDLLRDARLYTHLLKIDEDLAAKAQAGRCPHCQGRLDNAGYARKPRGGPLQVGPEYRRRFSLCCDACRKRVTPPSVRFFGRRVYLAPVLLIISAMRGQLTAARLRCLRSAYGVDRRTVVRWRRWWRETFCTTAFWRAVKGRLLPPVDADDLPAALLERFESGGATRVGLSEALTFLSPLTTRFVMAM